MKNTPRSVIYRIKATYKEHKGNSVLFNAHVWNVFSTALDEILQTNKEFKRLTRLDSNLEAKKYTMVEVVGNMLGLPDCETLCKSVEKISETDVISSIYTLDLYNPVKIDYVTFRDYIFKSKIKLPFKLKVAFVHDGHLYTTVCFPELNVKGSFSDNSSENDTCEFLDQPITANDYLINSAITAALKEFNIFKSIPYNREEEKIPVNNR